MRSPFGVAVGVARGSGPRVKGGVYWECPAKDVEVLTPPEPFDATETRLAALGIRLWDKDGVTHVLDWVGGSAYPTVESFVDEVRQHGLSRRLSNIHRLGVLSPHSKLYIIHGAALVAPDRPRTTACIVRAPLAGLSVVRAQDIYETVAARVPVPVRPSTL